MIRVWIRRAALVALVLVLLVGGAIPSSMSAAGAASEGGAVALAEMPSMPDCPDCAVGGEEKAALCFGLCASSAASFLLGPSGPDWRNGARLALPIVQSMRGVTGIPDPRPPTFAR